MARQAIPRVRDLAFDGENLWVGTFQGLWRISPDDSVTHFGTRNSGLAASDIRSVAHDGDSLWIGHGGGLQRLGADGQWSHWRPESSGLPAEGVAGLFHDGSDLWVATEGGGVARLGEDGEWTAWNLGQIRWAFGVHHDGESLWIAAKMSPPSEGRLSRIDGADGWAGTWRSGVESACSDGDNVWVGGRGVARLDAREVSTRWESGPDTLPSDAISTVHCDGSAVWAGGEAGVTCRFADDTWITRTDCGPVYSVLRAEEAVWIGSGRGALRATPLDRLLLPHLPVGSPQRLAVGHDGRPWVFGGGQAQRVEAGGRLSSIRDEFGLRRAALGPDGVWWQATSTGLGADEARLTTSHGLAHDDVRDVAVASDGTVWVATASGVSRVLLDEVFTLTIAGSRLPSDDVRAVVVDEADRPWFATSAGVALFNGVDFVVYGTADGLAHDSVSDLENDPSGALWAATDAGLSRFDGARFSAIEGVGATSVRVVDSLPDGRVLAGTNVGLFVVSVGGVVAHYTREHGLPGDEVRDIHVVPPPDRLSARQRSRFFRISSAASTPTASHLAMTSSRRRRLSIHCR